MRGVDERRRLEERRKMGGSADYMDLGYPPKLCNSIISVFGIQIEQFVGTME